MILVIDNYDSFTYNVVQALQRLGNEEVKVVRSKEITVEEIEKLAPSRLVVSPGPGTPSEAGVSEDAIKYFAGKIPILGVCLGHQAIGEAFGATIVQAKRICHGVVEEMTTDGRGLFRIVGKKSTFTRYHSLVIDESTLPPEFEVSSFIAYLYYSYEYKRINKYFLSWVTVSTMILIMWFVEGLYLYLQ